MSAMGLTVYSLWWREVIRFLRQRNRVMGSLLQPVIFWLLFGFGLGASFQPQGTGLAEGMSYLEFYFPGTIALIVLFTAIFSSISIIEDRNEGFLQSVLVAPVPRVSIVLGKVLGGTTLAVLHGLVFTVLAPFAGLPLHPLSFLYLLGAMTLVSLGLSAIGFCFAWRTDSSAGFHAIMSLILFPMWLLSGAFFPTAGVPTLLKWLMMVNPMTYGVALMRYALYRSADLGMEGPSLGLSLGVSGGFALVLVCLAPRLLRARDRD